MCGCVRMMTNSGSTSAAGVKRIGSGIVRMPGSATAPPSLGALTRTVCVSRCRSRGGLGGFAGLSFVVPMAVLCPLLLGRRSCCTPMCAGCVTVRVGLIGSSPGMLLPAGFGFGSWCKLCLRRVEQLRFQLRSPRQPTSSPLRRSDSAALVADALRRLRICAGGSQTGFAGLLE